MLSAFAFLTGCAAQSAAPPQQDIPGAFENVSVPGGQWPAQQWYRDFGSDELNTFIDVAAKTNSDLEAARARVTQADARARQAGAAILPAVDAVGTGNFWSGHSSQGGGHELDWSAMLSASYEVDFWGKNRATAQSARFLAGASRADRDAVALTTLAGVANGYFHLLAGAARAYQGRAECNRDAAKQLLDIVQSRFGCGDRKSPIDLATQKAAFDVAQIAIPDLQQKRKSRRARPWR